MTNLRYYTHSHPMPIHTAVAEAISRSTTLEGIHLDHFAEESLAVLQTRPLRKIVLDVIPSPVCCPETLQAAPIKIETLSRARADWKPASKAAMQKGIIDGLAPLILKPAHILTTLDISSPFAYTPKLFTTLCKELKRRAGGKLPKFPSLERLMISRLHLFDLQLKSFLESCPSLKYLLLGDSSFNVFVPPGNLQHLVKL